MTNNTAASKYIPRRPRISINWTPPFRPWMSEQNRPMQCNVVLTRPWFLKNPWLKLKTNKTKSRQLKLSWCTEMTKEPNFLTVCEIFGHLWNLDLTTLITWYFCVKTRLRHTVIYKKRKKVKKERFFLKKNKSFNLFRGLWSSSSGFIEVSTL